MSGLGNAHRLTPHPLPLNELLPLAPYPIAETTRNKLQLHVGQEMLTLFPEHQAASPF